MLRSPPGVAGDQGPGSRDGRGPVAAGMHAPRPLKATAGHQARRQCPHWQKNPQGLQRSSLRITKDDGDFVHHPHDPQNARYASDLATAIR